jgi:hypothetical protein
MHPDVFIRALEAKIFRLRAKIVNLEVGTLAWSLGMAALGTDAPRMYAFFGMVIVVVFMDYRLRSFDRIYKLWRDVKHELVMTKNVWWHFPVFNAGWLFLGLVAMGILTKHSILGSTTF